MAQEGTFNTVSVQFYGDTSNRRYTYKIAKHYLVEVDNLAVVETNTGFKLVQITEVHSKPQIDYKLKAEYRWIVGIVPLNEYNEQKKKDVKLRKELKRPSVSRL